MNLYVERQQDKTMKRTANRPLPAGRIKASFALLFGLSTSVAGLGLLYLYTNTLTAALAALTIILYVYLYTPLKRVTKYNTLVGTIPGALPALGGWTAATGSFGLGGWIVFAILVIWQLPHFFSLAWMYRKDYEKGGFKMLPVVEPSGDSTAWQILLSSALLLAACAAPYFLGLTGLLYFIGTLVVSIWMLSTSIDFFVERTNANARKVLKASIVHIPLFVLFLTIDRFL